MVLRRKLRRIRQSLPVLDCARRRSAGLAMAECLGTLAVKSPSWRRPRSS